jgi:hypothetical protein
MVRGFYRRAGVYGGDGKLKIALLAPVVMAFVMLIISTMKLIRTHKNAWAITVAGCYVATLILFEVMLI